jgi:hypothetical protein
MPEQPKTFMVEDAFIRFSNFEGKEGRFNQKGQRNFTIDLPRDVAEQMLLDGWNVNFYTPQNADEGFEPIPIIRIGVRFDIRPPRITLLTSTSRTQLDESSVEVLDWADIKTVDLIANGYDWDVNGKTGTKAYLQTMFITIQEDALERKYAIEGEYEI